MKVAVFAINWLGVSETFIFRQLRALEYSQRLIVLTQKLKESPILEENKKIEIDVYYCPVTEIDFWKGVIKRKLGFSGNQYAASLSQRRSWETILTSKQVDLIHAHYGPAGLIILDLAKRLKIPLVTTFHGNDASVMIRKKAYLQALNELFDYSYIITVSEFIKTRLIKLGANPKRVICHYIGTDLSKFTFSKRIPIKVKAENKEEIVFLQVSNFVEKKGQTMTISAFSRFCKYYPNAKLLFAGTGSTEQECKNLVRNLNLDDKISFLGSVSPDRVSELMRTSDVFLHHSVTGKNGSEEGIPTVLMEAMASGIPVVSTKHSGIPELITDKISGFLVKERDIDDYLDVLRNLLKIDTTDIIENAKEQVYEKFDISKQNKILLKIYEDIVSGRF